MRFLVFTKCIVASLCALLITGTASADQQIKTTQPPQGVIFGHEHKSKSHHHHHSHHSSSHDHPISNSPPYIKSDDGKPVMRIAVIKRTDAVSSKLLDKVLKVVSEQVERDFSPYYGISVEFKVFKHSKDVDWHRYVPLVIPDLLLFDVGPAISFHDFQQVPSLSLVTGDPIGIFISDAPDIPIATPYIIIPMGNAGTDYGVIPAAISDDPSLPPTFETIFSFALSHEVLETLHNYTGALFTATSPSVDGACVIDFYYNEVCDPVEYSPGYVIHDFNVANFVLPSYWEINLPAGPYDFLNTVLSPFTPFQGEQLVNEFAPGCEAEVFLLASIPPPSGNPFDLIVIDEGSVFAPCAPCAPCDSLKHTKASSKVSGARIYRSAKQAASKIKKSPHEKFSKKLSLGALFAKNAPKKESK